MMNTLASDLRKQLERTVIQAREVAEEGSRAALEALAVHHHEPYAHMDGEQRALRRRLRAHARQIGDRLYSPLPPGEGAGVRAGSHGIDHLVQECAYEHWHGMLFARFLAESDLLIEPEMGVAISLDECEELAKEERIDKWQLAARFAHHMLPQVFRPDVEAASGRLATRRDGASTKPVFEVQLAREYRLKLEGLVEDLPVEVFTATDALGWVYQFWQTKKKEEVNRSEVKIGADELPAVTQLFTEPYMVQFLLHNSLGAWWVSRHPDKPCPVELTYLRKVEAASRRFNETRRDGASTIPAAGTVEGWPDDLTKFRLLDPCCGSGHFLVAAFLMLVPMRMALENLSAAEAVDAVLRDNLHGLELDQRCVAIAAFALALEAWRFADAGGYRSLPRLNLAWCGQPVAGKREQWLALAEGDSRLEAGMAALYDTFRDAPVLGSLIDPTRSVAEDLLTAGFKELEPLLEQALQDHSGEEEWEETAIAARGLADAARLLGNHYHLVITNVPYLARGKQSERLCRFAETHYPKAKNDLANVFLERCLELSGSAILALDEKRLEAASTIGVVQIVMPQNWLFLTSYKKQREHLLKEVRWDLVARLGPGAFDTISGEVVNVILLTLTRVRPNVEDQLHGIDASAPRMAAGKAEVLRDGEVVAVSQQGQLGNPDARVALEETRGDLLAQYAIALNGMHGADSPRFRLFFWEPSALSNWRFLQNTVDTTVDFSGRSQIFFWPENGDIHRNNPHARIQGDLGWGQVGVTVSMMRELPCTLYTGEAFDISCSPIIPQNSSCLPAIWCFCSSPEYNEAVRRIDQKLNVTNATLVKVPFDLDYWSQIAKERYPNGLPKSYSNDPTQWIFHGHPCGSVIWDEEKKWTAHGPLRTDAPVLQVAVARLLGYRWPAEGRSGFQPLDLETKRKDGASTILADEARAWVEKAKSLYPFEDEDGIVCIPSVRGERPAHERLLHLLEAAWGDDWNDGVLSKLLAAAGSTSLDDWLRNQFFEQHCKLFHHRPFIWHIWDGRKRDGFHALVNYHKLAEGDGKGRRLLESLTYSYLGDWIARQEDGVKRGEGGAEDRFAAAVELQKRLVAILEGEPPCDIFVRWKPIVEAASRRLKRPEAASTKEQPIGWEPDINDGVRLNIRPFMAQDIPGGKKCAGILRAKPNIHWKKDRGKEPMREQERFPWFWKDGKFTGGRVNDVHLTNAEKRKARDLLEGKQ